MPPVPKPGLLQDLYDILGGGKAKPKAAPPPPAAAAPAQSPVQQFLKTQPPAVAPQNIHGQAIPQTAQGWPAGTEAWAAPTAAAPAQSPVQKFLSIFSPTPNPNKLKPGKGQQVEPGVDVIAKIAAAPMPSPGMSGADYAKSIGFREPFQFSKEQISALMDKMMGVTPAQAKAGQAAGAANPLDAYAGQKPSDVPPMIWNQATLSEKTAFAKNYDHSKFVAPPPINFFPPKPSTPESAHAATQAVAGKVITQEEALKYMPTLKANFPYYIVEPDGGLGGYATKAEAEAELAAAKDKEPKAPPNRLLPKLGWDAELFRKEFNISGYHGTASPTQFTEFALPKELSVHSNQFGVHLGTSKAAHDIHGIADPSGKRADLGARIFPLMARVKNPLDLPDLGAWGVPAIAGELRAKGFPEAEVAFAEKSEPMMHAYLTSKGYDGIRYKNSAEDPGSISYIVWNPAQLRVPWAKFDPKNKHMRNLMASVAGGLVIPAAVEDLSGGGEAQAAEASQSPVQQFLAKPPGVSPAAPAGQSPVQQFLSGAAPDHRKEQGLQGILARSGANQAREPVRDFMSIVHNLPNVSAGQLGQDISDVFTGGVKKVRQAMTSGPMASAKTIGQRMMAASKPGDPSGPIDVLMSWFKGPMRTVVARPIAERRGTAVENVEMITDLAEPGLGVVPYAKLPKLFQRAGPDALKTFTQATSDDLFKLRQTSVADRIELEQKVQEMPQPERTDQVQSIVYNLIERKDYKHLPAADQAFLADPQNLQTVVGAAMHLHPLRLELSNLYNRLRKLGIPDTDLVDPEYVHRRVVGHDRTLDPITSTGQADNPIMGIQRTLPQTTQALQARKMLGGQAADGSRVVISEDAAGNWTVHTGGKVTDIAHPSPANPDQFTYKGKTYDVGQATSQEIETATAAEAKPTKYYKNALANTVDALARMRAVERHVDWLDNLKKSPEWAQWATKSKKAGMELGYKKTDLPQLDGWYMNPKLQAAFDDFYSPGVSDKLAAARKINQFATATLFWNPVPHVENVWGHWLVGRGFDWIKPQGVKSLFLDGAEAVRAVTTQNANYRRLLKHGSGMVLGGVQQADFYRNVAQLAGMDIKRQPARWDPIARTLGIGPSDLAREIYKGANRTLWWFNDVFMMQRVLELERKGMTTARAVKEAEKHIPNYRIPTEVMGSRLLSNIMQEPALTVFSRYHYGVFNSYANMIRDIVQPLHGQDRIDAIGNLAALMFLTAAIYPALEAGIQTALGDPEAKKLRRGPSAVPSGIREMYEGDRRWEQIIGEAITLPALTQAATTIVQGGTDPFTGQPITQPQSGAVDQAAQGADWALGKMVQPWQLLGRKPESEGGNSPGREMFNQVVGMRNTSEAAQRGQRISKKMQKRRARKQAIHPRGPIERFLHYGGTDE